MGLLEILSLAAIGGVGTALVVEKDRVKKGLVGAVAGGLAGVITSGLPKAADVLEGDYTVWGNTWVRNWGRTAQGPIWVDNEGRTYYLDVISTLTLFIKDVTGAEIIMPYYFNDQWPSIGASATGQYTVVYDATSVHHTLHALKRGVATWSRDVAADYGTACVVYRITVSPNGKYIYALARDGALGQWIGALYEGS